MKNSNSWYQYLKRPKTINDLTRELKVVRLKNGCKSHLFTKVDNEFVQCDKCQITKKVLNIAR